MEQYNLAKAPFFFPSYIQYGLQVILIYSLDYLLAPGDLA
ncbi:hypothetical protein TNCV_1426891, partial [Trichonephila clavipes]